MNGTNDNSAAGNHLDIQRYYWRHAPVYDATRWTFLFGRDRLLKLIEECPAPLRVLEVGSGTARNLVRLAGRFPNAHFTGVDLSPAMVARARRRTRKQTERFQWFQAAYDKPLYSTAQFDLVLFSYSLSMMKPGWEAAMKAASADLVPGGRIAVVDFHRTPLEWFRRWMADHHVHLDGHLLPALCKQFRPRLASREPAYCNGWEYFLFLGTKRAAVDTQAASANERFRPARIPSLPPGPFVPGRGEAPSQSFAERRGRPSPAPASALIRASHTLSFNPKGDCATKPGIRPEGRPWVTAMQGHQRQRGNGRRGAGDWFSGKRAATPLALG